MELWFKGNLAIDLRKYGIFVTRCPASNLDICAIVLSATFSDGRLKDDTKAQEFVDSVTVERIEGIRDAVNSRFRGISLREISFRGYPADRFWMLNIEDPQPNFEDDLALAIHVPEREGLQLNAHLGTLYNEYYIIDFEFQFCPVIQQEQGTFVSHVSNRVGDQNLIVAVHAEAHQEIELNDFGIRCLPYGHHEADPHTRKPSTGYEKSVMEYRYLRFLPQDSRCYHLRDSPDLPRLEELDRLIIQTSQDCGQVAVFVCAVPDRFIKDRQISSIREQSAASKIDH